MWPFKKKEYFCPYTITYKSPRYSKTCTVPKGYKSDGATGAFDIWSEGWWVHDVLCDRCTWDDGTPITNWEASRVLSDILKSEGRWVRNKTWLVATFLLGGWSVKKANGWV